MKRAIFIAAGVLLLAGLTWALWPSEEPEAASVLDDGKPKAAVKSLADRLQDDEARAEGDFDGGRRALTGLVQNEDAQPVAGATVVIYRVSANTLENQTCPICGQPLLECADPHTASELLEVLHGGKGAPRPIGTVVSGADGTFMLPDVPNDELRVVATQGALIGRDNFEPGNDVVVVVSPRTRILMKVKELGFNLEGEAVPLAGARVTALPLDSLELSEGVTDAAGEVRLDAIDDGGGIWFFVQSPGLIPSVTTLYSSSEEGYEVVLEKSRSLRVKTLVGGKPTEAVVNLTGGRLHPQRQKTQGGIALFDGLTADEYEAIAATETMVSPRQSASLEGEVTTIEFELRAAARVLVTVIDESGQPVENAEVSISGHDGDYRSETTNQGDLVILGPVGEGSLTLEVSGDDFRPWRRELDVHPGDNPIEVVMRKGVKLRGRVVDSEGKPVLQASVEAHAPVSMATMGFTDADGNFELTLDDPGPQELVAAHSTVGRTTINVTAPADDLVIRLDPKGRIHVFAHEGREPVAGAMVSVMEINGRGMSLNAVTGDDGTAMLSGLESATYRVQVQSSDFRNPPPTEVAVVEGKVDQLDIALDRGLAVEGMVVDERGVGVAANVHTEPWTSNTRSDEEGHFVLTTLDPLTTYKVEAETDTAHAGPTELKGAVAGFKLVLKARPVITGRVVDQLTEAPITTFTINARPVESADGRFSEPANTVNGDTLILEIGAEGYEAVEYEGALSAGNDIGTIKLPKAKQVEGVVRDQRGSPVAGAIVTCDSAGEEVTTAADGSFHLQLSHFEVGTTVSARRGQLKGTVALELGRLAQITLAAPTRVLGQVVDGEGRPVAGAVTIRDALGEDEVRAEAGNDGNFSIDLASGRWLFVTRLNQSGQSFQVSGPTMRVLLGTPPGSCAITITSSGIPDEVLLIPGEATPRADTPFEQLASLDGTVVFDTSGSGRVLTAAGFRCGTYTLFARWGAAQRVQRVDVRIGPNVLSLPAPPPEMTMATGPMEP